MIQKFTILVLRLCFSARPCIGPVGEYAICSLSRRVERPLCPLLRPLHPPIARPAPPDPCRTAGKRAGNDAKNGLVDSLNDDFTKLRGEQIGRYNGQRIMRTKLAILEHNLPGEL